MPKDFTHESIWVVVPAFNEEAAIGNVLKELQSANYSTVVVDDCSSDQTAKVVSEYNVTLCRHAINLGQGAALQTGLSYALSQGASYVVTFDSDGQHQVSDIPSLLAPLKSGQAEVALGSRFAAGGKAENISWARVLLLKCATFYTRLTSGLKLTDTHNGLRAFSAEAARNIKLTQNRMAHASEILSQIASHRMPYIEIPVHIRYTEYSLQKGQRMSNSFNILWESLMGALRR